LAHPYARFNARDRDARARRGMTAHDDDNPQVYRMGEGPYALNDDDTAKDPVAFREALAKDVGKLKDIEKDEALAKALLGEDTGAMQEALKKLMTMVRGWWFCVRVFGLCLLRRQ